MLSEQTRYRDGLEGLLSRRSAPVVQEPGPGKEELDIILDAGLRAPDHGLLRPWRFIVIRGDARACFAEILVEASRLRDPSISAVRLERLRTQLSSVPLLIGVGAQIDSQCRIPQVELLLSAGAAAMNMLNAIHMLGYGGIWVTGPHTYDRNVNEALGLSAPSQLVGMLFVGTAKGHLGGVERPQRGDHVVEWVQSVAPSSALLPPRDRASAG